MIYKFFVKEPGNGHFIYEDGVLQTSRNKAWMEEFFESWADCLMHPVELQEIDEYSGAVNVIKTSDPFFISPNI